MEWHALGIEGAWRVTTAGHDDERGSLTEWFRADALARATGRRFDLAQANVSVSRASVVRGIHYADVPPSQAKYVTCLAGAVLDVVVDLRVGSPTFGRWEACPLDGGARDALFLSEGLGHGFSVLAGSATVAYLCSTPYTPAREHAVCPVDPGLGIDWRVAEPVLSRKDRSAPALADALAAGALPDYETCRAFVAAL